MKKRIITARLWTWFKPKLMFVWKYFITQSYKAKVEWKTLREQLQDTRAERILFYQKRIKLASDKLNQVIQQGWEWFAGTRDDFDEIWGGSRYTRYTGQELAPSVHFVQEYNQLENKDLFGFTQCFLYAPIWEVSDNLGLTFSPEERKEMSFETRNSKEYDINIGGYSTEGMRIVWELLESKWEEFNLYHFPTSSKWLRHVLDKGYSVLIGIRVSSEMLQGMRWDWELTINEITGRTKYNHFLRAKMNKEGTVDLFYDNYKGVQKYNVFTLEELDALARAGKFMNNSFFHEPKGKTLTRLIDNKDKVKEVLDDRGITLTKDELYFVLKFSTMEFEKSDYAKYLQSDNLAEKRAFMIVNQYRDSKINVTA